MNAAWHESHRKTKMMNVDEEIAWHIAHKQHCGCRPIPKSIQKKMHQRGVVEHPVGFNVGLDKDFHPDVSHLAGQVPLPEC